MITLFAAATPNGRKASIMLEECALDYNVPPLSWATVNRSRTGIYRSTRTVASR